MNKIPAKYYLVADQLIFSGMSFLLTIASSQYFDIRTFGVFASMVIGIYLLLSISHALIIQPMQIFINKLDVKHSYKGFLLMCLFLKILVIWIIAFTIDLLGFSFFDTYIKYLYSIPFYASVFLAHDFFRKYFLADDEVYHAFVIDSLVAVFQLIALTYVFFIASGDLNHLLMALSIAYLPSIFIATLKFPFSIDFKANRAYLLYHTKEGKWLLFTAIIQWFSNNLFVLFSGVFISLSALAALRLAQTIFGILNVILQTVENYVIPLVNRLHVESSHRSIQYLQNLSKKGLALIGLVLIPFLFFSKTMMYWIGGSEYLPYHEVFIGLSLLYFLIFAAYPIRISIRILELNKVFFIGYFISFLAGLLSFQFLLKNFQLSGAVAGLILNQLIMIAVWQFTLNKRNFQLWKSYI